MRWGALNLLFVYNVELYEASPHAAYVAKGPVSSSVARDKSRQSGTDVFASCISGCREQGSSRASGSHGGKWGASLMPFSHFTCDVVPPERSFAATVVKMKTAC